jgi:hypothetical protein
MLIALCWLVLFLAVCAGLIHLIGRLGVSSGRKYAPDFQLTGRLVRTPVVRRDGRGFYGRAWREERGDLTVVFLAGTPYEMGFQHGRLLADRIRAGVAPVFADPIGLSENWRTRPWWMRALMNRYLEVMVYGPIERSTPEAYLEEIKGLADGAGMSYRRMFVANFLSDLNMATAPGLIAKKAGVLPPLGGCTSVVAPARSAADGRMLVGRNTDYTGQGPWAANQVVFYFQPDSGYRYTKVSTAGMLKCNSAMNEKGVTVGGHFMCFSGGTVRGWSFTVLENEIMRRAGDLEGALDVAAECPRGGSFGLMLAHGPSGDAAALEAAGPRLGLRRLTGEGLVLTNFALTDRLKPVDVAASHGVMLRSLVGRFDRATALLARHRGRFDPAVMAGVMSDHHDPILAAERALGATVCFEGNVTSVVFQPQTGYFWVAAGPAPVCSHTYHGFDFWADLEGRPPGVAPAELPPAAWTDPRRERALRSFMDGLVVYKEDAANIELALVLIEEARELDPEEPFYHKFAARMAARTGRVDRAEAIIRAWLELKQAANDRAQAWLLWGQTLEAAGRRPEAEDRFRRVVELAGGDQENLKSNVNHVVLAAARSSLAQPRRRRLEHLAVLDEMLE